MSLGSISSSTVAAAFDAARLMGGKAAEGGPKAAAVGTTIADHVAAADDHEPIRSLSSTQGTLLDTYL